MLFGPAWYSLLFGSTISISLVAAFHAWDVRREPGGLGLVITLLGICLWAICVFAITVTPARELTVLFLRIRILAVNVTTVSMFVTVVSYTGYEQYVSWRTIGLLAVWPVVSNLIAWLRPGLVWSTIEFDQLVGMGVETTYGIAFGIHVAYAYLLVVGSILLLAASTVTTRGADQKRIVVVFVAILAPFVTNIVYLAGGFSSDLTVIGFLLTGISLTWILQRERLFDLKPIARDSVFETLTSGVFVVDTDTHLVDCNQRGMELLGISASDLGRPTEELLESSTEAAALFSKIADSTAQQSIQTDIDGQHYEIEMTPLYDDRDSLVGRVLLVHDITESKRQQARLARQNERLDQFAAVVSHDLRNPLTVASGYLGLARKTGNTEYFDRVETSHRRMEELIDELLTFARLDEGDFKTSPVDFESCVSSAWRHVQTADAELVVDSELPIEANREYLLQLLENLIRNSVEHGGPGVTIMVAVEEPEEIEIVNRPDTVRFVVSDDGKGIPPDERESVLKQGHTTGDGVGLGLAIVSQIAEAHGWSVDVTESEAGGAAFVFDGVEIATGDSNNRPTSTAT